MSLPKDWQQVFNSEAKQGYLNSGVIGGFSEWVSDSIENIADNKFNKQIKVDVKILAKNYAEANLLERPIIFNQISALLETADWKVIEKQENKQSISATVWDSHKTLETSIQFLKGVGPKKSCFFA